MSRPTCTAMLIVTILVAAASRSAAAATPSPNLLANPGFEESLLDHPWMPAAWDTFQSGLSTVFFGRDTLQVHGGRYAVTAANVSTLIPMWHNWSQTLVVGPEYWGKDLVFSVWSRTNGLQGRAYVLLQAYRDTVEKMARTWKVERDTAGVRLGILKTNDPFANLGWKRQYFSEPETDWVKREVRVFIPPSTNVVIVRCGIFGIGQVVFDDASLTSETARPSPPVPLHTNLLADPGFEGEGNDWEYSMPPFEGMVVEPDTTVKHGGRRSIRMEGGLSGPVFTRAGVCQPFANRNLSGKRVRLSGYIKTDSLYGEAYIKIYCTTLEGDVQDSTPEQFGLTTDWTRTVMEVDTPPGTYMVWGWFLYNAPAQGRLYYDDVSMEVLGPANYIQTGARPPKAPAR